MKLFGKYTADDIVKQYLMLRTRKQNDAKAFKETLKELDDAMEVLEGAAAIIMRSTGQVNLATESGTAYQSPWDRYSVEDPEVWHKWVRETQNWDMYTNAVSKEAIDAFLERTKTVDKKTGAVTYTLPPGIKHESGININFRKSS